MGSVVAGGLSVGLATALLFVSRARTSPDVGPTAATLGDAFSTLAGAGLGLLIGSGLTACLVRRGSRIVSGIFAGVIAYAAVLLPIIVLTGPSDVSAAESFALGLTLAIPLGLFVLLGAIAGSAIAVALQAARVRRNRDRIRPPRAS